MRLDIHELMMRQYYQTAPGRAELADFVAAMWEYLTPRQQKGLIKEFNLELEE